MYMLVFDAKSGGGECVCRRRLSERLIFAVAFQNVVRSVIVSTQTRVPDPDDNTDWDCEH